MKFDKIYNDLFEKLELSEMAIHVYNQDPLDAVKTRSPISKTQAADWAKNGAPKVGLHTDEEVLAKKTQFKQVFKATLKDRLHKKGYGEHGIGYALTDLTNSINNAITNTSDVPVDLAWSADKGADWSIEEQVYDTFADIFLNKAFTGGRNNAITWDEFEHAKSETSTCTEEALNATADIYASKLGLGSIPGFSSTGTKRHYLLTNVIKDVLISSGAFFTDEPGADYLSGTKTVRGRKSAADKAAELAQPGFTVHQESRSRLDEMPVRLRRNTSKGDTTDLDTLKRSMRSSFVDKHQRVNDPLLSTNVSLRQRDGSNTYHVGELAKHLSGKSSIHDVPEESVQQACDIFAEIIHEKMFQMWDNVNPATTKHEFRNLMTHAVEQAVEIIEAKYGSDIFSNIDPAFTSRVIDKGLEALTSRTGHDDTLKTWNKATPSTKISENTKDDESAEYDDEDDDEEDEEGDDDENSDTEDIAYKQGILKDEDEKEVEEDSEEDEEEDDTPTESEEEESADTLASRIEQTGTDIARLFLQALDDLENEEDSEEDDIVDDEVGLDDDEDVRGYLGRTHSREDEEEEKYRGWGNFNDEEY